MATVIEPEDKMGAASDYRQFAIAQRKAASSAPLPMVRDKHISAAERWETLAAELERCEAGTLNFRDQRQEFFH